MGGSDMSATVIAEPVKCQVSLLHVAQTILLSVLCFFVLDNLIFRSGLYARIIKPEAIGGQLLDIVQFNSADQINPVRDVLILGNSKIASAFGTGDFEQLYPNANLRPLMGAVPGSTLKWWYYQLRAQDPNQDRYKAIVIPLEGYKIPPRSVDQENQYSDAQMLAPIISLRDWPGFLSSFTDPAVRARARLLAIFTSHAYSFDLHDLLLRPIQRIWGRIQRNRMGLNPLQSNRRGTLEELKIDTLTGKPSAYPAGFGAFNKRVTDDHFVGPTPDQAKAWTARTAIFESTWIRRIVNDYKDSETRLIFINIPRWPMPLPALKPIGDAPDMMSMIPAHPNIIVLPEDEFTHLEQPKYFADVMHMNDAGRLLFTRQLGQKLRLLIAGRVEEHAPTEEEGQLLLSGARHDQLAIDALHRSDTNP
jgi:hypothetical protein